jgi:hypothetical protein
VDPAGDYFEDLSKIADKFQEKYLFLLKLIIYSCYGK